MDNALAAFETELKAQGVWDDTVLLTSSDFGRTYASNGAGTDHAWCAMSWGVCVRVIRGAAQGRRAMLGVGMRVIRGALGRMW
jgi:uncharacterized protein (DUF1501 family)